MKYFLSLLIIFVLLLNPVCSAEKPTVIISKYQITPSILTPGEIGSITVTLTNTASQATKTASVTSEGKSPSTETVTLPVNAFIQSAILKTKDFEILDGWYEDIGDIGPGQSTTLTFMIRAPDHEGVFFPEVWIRIQDGESVKYPIPVNVNTGYALSKKPNFQVIRTVPDQVIPGDSFNISLNLLNQGSARAHDITIQVVTPNSSISSLSPEQYYIPVLDPKEKKEINLSFTTDSDIQVGIQQFPVLITCFGADGEKFAQSALIGVLIQGKAEVGIAKILMEPSRVTAGDPFTLIIRVENTGTDSAKSIRASLNLPVEGGKETYIGTIDPNNDAPAIFNLKANDSGDFSYNLTVDYHDEWGSHTSVIPLQITIEQKGGIAGVVLPLLLLIIVCGGYLYWQRSQHGKQ